MSKENLEGKFITVFLEGGWELSGEVKSMDDRKFVIEKDGDLMLVFKDKISALIISEKERIMNPSGDHPPQREGLPRPAKVTSSPPAHTFPMNPITYEESGMSIPRALLAGEIMDEDDNLSMFFPGGHDLENNDATTDSRIQFGLEDDTENKD